MRRRWAGLLACVAVLSTSCAYVDAFVVSDLDRAAYGDARRQVAEQLGAPESRDPIGELATASGEPITDLESAVDVMLAAAGAQRGSREEVVARYFARILTDPAWLCGEQPVNPLEGLAVPELVAQVSNIGEVAFRFPDCTEFGRLDFADIRIGGVSLRPSTDPRGRAIIEGNALVHYLVPTPEGIVPLSATADAGFTFGLPSLATGVNLLMPLAAEGFATAGYPAADAFAPTLTRIGSPESGSSGPTEAAGAVGVLTGTGPLLPTQGAMRLDLAADPSPELSTTQVILTEQSRHFSARPATLLAAQPDSSPWQLRDLSIAATDYETGLPNSPFVLFDWLQHLAATSAIPCTEKLPGEACYAVRIPVERLLTPDTPGYRNATALAQARVTDIALGVGISDGRLSAVQVEGEVVQPWAGTESEDETYLFTDYDAAGELPVIEEPTYYDE